jgi:hypothetical protein
LVFVSWPEAWDFAHDFHYVAPDSSSLLTVDGDDVEVPVVATSCRES